MVRGRGIGLAIGVATVIAALCAGCGGGNPEPSPVATSSVSPSASASSAPTMPAEAKGTSAASAEAFVRYYFTVYSYAARTGDTDPMKDLATDSCESCAKVAALIDKTYGAGGSATGRGYQVGHFSAISAIGAEATMQGTVTQFAQRLVPSASAAPTTFPRNHFRARFELTSINGLWRMMGWFVL